ncbi:MAG: putative sulfate/molybdate transporter [Actinomycetota bacterium]
MADRTAARPRVFGLGLGEATGAMADLGVMVPLAASLVLVNGLDPGAVMVGAGLLVLLAGLVFRVPFPVQPLKALAAVAVAEGLSPDVIHAAGLEIAVFLLLLSVGRVADLLARLFTKPVVRALQFGVGALLVVAAARLALEPPGVFAGVPASPWPVVLALAAFVWVTWAARGGRYGAALALMAGGILAAWLVAHPSFGGPELRFPRLELPPPSAFSSAFLLLVVPQLPLTFGNAVVAVSDLARDYFGDRARRVTPTSVCLSCGAGNVVAAVIGGMPMCHGAGGLTAHVRLGARTAGMNVLLGGAFLVLGLLFASQVPLVLAVLPVWALAAFLAYAGLRHAWLVADLRGWPMVLAVSTGAIGAAMGNLAVTAGAALLMVHGGRLLVRVTQPAGNGPRGPGSYATSSNTSS